MTRLHENMAGADGGNVWSAMQYCFDRWPEETIGLLRVYDGHTIPLIAWFTGFAYALRLVEDHGPFSDLDEVLHNWFTEEPYNIEAAVRRILDDGTH